MSTQNNPSAAYLTATMYFRHTPIADWLLDDLLTECNALGGKGSKDKGAGTLRRVVQALRLANGRLANPPDNTFIGCDVKHERLCYGRTWSDELRAHAPELLQQLVNEPVIVDPLHEVLRCLSTIQNAIGNRRGILPSLDALLDERCLARCPAPERKAAKPEPTSHEGKAIWERLRIENTCAYLDGQPYPLADEGDATFLRMLKSAEGGPVSDGQVRAACGNTVKTRTRYNRLPGAIKKRVHAPASRRQSRGSKQQRGKGQKQPQGYWFKTTLHD